MYFGFSRGIYPIGGEWGRWLNIALVLQFPVSHSALLSARGRAILGGIVPFGIGKDLSTTTFAIISSLQLLAVFLLWTPSEVVWWAPAGGVLWLFNVAFACSWLFLTKAIKDSSFALHSGFLGWGAVFRGVKPIFPSPSSQGTFRVVRQPIYLAFLLILLTGPVWTLDHTVVASIWGAYCMVGPLMKEKRLIHWHGESYRRYRESVPYMFPRLR